MVTATLEACGGPVPDQYTQVTFQLGQGNRAFFTQSGNLDYTTMTTNGQAMATIHWQRWYRSIQR